MYIYGNAILVGTKDSLHFMFTERIQEVCETEGSILNNRDWSSISGSRRFSIGILRLLINASFSRWLTVEYIHSRYKYLQYPGTIATECVSSVYDVPMFREACKEIANTL